MAPIALASAHWPCGKAAFSTLQPAKTRPLRAADGSADREARVGRVGVGTGGSGGGEQLVQSRKPPLILGQAPVGIAQEVVDRRPRALVRRLNRSSRLIALNRALRQVDCQRFSSSSHIEGESSGSREMIDGHAELDVADDTSGAATP